MAGGLGGLNLEAPKATNATASVGGHDGGGEELRPLWQVLGVKTFDPGSHTQHTQTNNNTDRQSKAEGRNTQEGSRVKRTNPRTGSQSHEFTARVYSQRAAAARRAAWRAASEAWT